MNDFGLTHKERTEMNEATDSGIRQAEINAHEEWKSMAYEAVITVAQQHAFFTINDVREIVRKSHLKTHDNRAMGGVIKRAQKEGIVAPTGNSIPSVVGHKTQIQIWKSLLYTVPPQAKLF